MPRIRLIMLSMLAVFAIGAVASATSSAFMLEWQVCEKVAAGSGKFENHLCKKEGGTKEWEWKTLAAGESRKVISEGGPFTLTAGTKTVTCNKVKNHGEIFGGHPGTDEVTVNFETCTTSEVGCKVKSKGTAKAGEVVVANVKTKLTERGTKLADEFKENATTKEFITLEFGKEENGPEKLKTACPTLPETRVKGQVAAEIVNANEELNFPNPELTGNTLEAFGVAAKLVGKSKQTQENGWAIQGI